MSYRRQIYSLRSGFSLVELLVVLAIGGIMAVLTVPVIASLMQSGSVNQTVSGISLTLEEARAYAMANNTYVWVGFYEDPVTTTLTMSVAAGRSGQSSDLATATYAPIMKLQAYPHFILNKNITLSAASNSAIDVSNSLGTFQQKMGNTTVTLSQILQFDPRGEASLPSITNTSHWIQIGLQPSRGNKTSDPNVAVIQLARLTGQVTVFRQ